MKKNPSIIKKIIDNVKNFIFSVFTFISVTVTVAGMCLYLYEIPFLEFMELKTLDLRFVSREPVATSSKIVLAVVDEKSLADPRLGNWVWPRTVIAELITKLSEKGARVIAFDIGFFEPDKNSKQVIEAIDEIKSELQRCSIDRSEITAYIENLKQEADNDSRLAHAIKNSRSKIVLGYFFHTEAEIPKHIKEQDIEQYEQDILSSRYDIVRSPAEGFADTVMLKEASAPQPNIRVISDAADCSGFFNMFPDEDGVVRWIPGIIRFKGGLYVPLSMEMVGAYLNAPLSVRLDESGIRSVHIGSKAVAVNEFGLLMINYRGEEKTFPHIPIADILYGDLPEETFQDKIVIVGATAAGIYDMRVTPLGSTFPGLEIHANIADSILSEDFLYRPAWVTGFDLAAMLIAGFLLRIFIPRTRAASGAAVAAVLFVSHILTAQYLFSRERVIVSIFYPLCVIVLLYVAIIAYRYFTESKQKQFIKDAFSSYLAPSVVEYLIDNPGKLILGGQERIITAFFSDVQGFTGISEKLSPNEVVALLNEFLTEMTNIILDHKGTVDKFEGDAIVAFFGAPNDLKNQARAACMAGIDMQKRLVQLREQWRKNNKPELKMRIGMFTGLAVVGNMGSRQRMDYTMMGDTVNTAARLEGVNKFYGTYTLIGERTRNEVGNTILTREIDMITVVGKKEAVRIYELMGYAEDMDPKTFEVTEKYAEGLNAYRNKDWDRAEHFFNTVLECSPDDGPSLTLLERCAHFRINPPSESWNGSFMMETK